jgi:hypothetical protein
MPSRAVESANSCVGGAGRVEHGLAAVWLAERVFDLRLMPV